MERLAYKDLLKWKESERRKPLLVQGARQVGKTYLIRQFGEREYKNFIYLNFEQSANLRLVFSGDLNPEKLIENLGIYIGKKIESKNTLIFFDEIQVSEEALTSLKYFYEETPEFHIIAAGSLLGVSVAKNRSFPVGKVSFLSLYPMSFREYLLAFGYELLFEQLHKILPNEPLPEFIHQKLQIVFKQYLFLGGMPEVLENYRNNKDIAEVRKNQNEILSAYKRDFSKYTDTFQVVKTTQLWNSIPYQLAKENKKFKYSDVQHKARASHYEFTIDWLKNAGLINIVNNISVPKLPLPAYADATKFKLYLPDSGILGAMLNVPSEIIVKPNAIFQEYNGAFIENYVASELINAGFKDLFYWTSPGAAEVDFVIQHNDRVYPIEVKSGLNKNLKSLRSYQQKYNPSFIIRTSPRNFIVEKDFVNIPLYAISMLPKFLQDLMQLHY